MKRENAKKYEQAISSFFTEVYDITTPKIPGSLNSVFIVDSSDGKYVCKQNHYDLALKNLETSKIFNNAGIPVPDINLKSYGNLHFETYRLIPGKTLYEHIGAGLSDNKLKNVFNELVVQFIEMEKIRLPQLTDQKYKYAHQVARTNISDSNNRFLGYTFGALIKLLNHPGTKDKGLYHCGMTPKNIVLNKDGTFVSFLDLDEISIADKSYAFSTIATKYQQLGFDINELLDLYEDKSQQIIDRKRIKAMTNLNNSGRRLLWKQRKNKHSR